MEQCYHVVKSVHTIYHAHIDLFDFYFSAKTNELRLEISNNVVCATSKCSDQPAHMLSLTITFASRLNIL